MRRLQQADQAACEELCQRFGARLHRYAASLLAGDEDLAEDVMVATFADAIRNIKSFDSRRSTLSAWLHGIARRQVIGERRRQRRRSSVPASMQVSLAAIEDLPRGDDLASDLASRLDARRTMAQLAQVLSEAEMEMLMLHAVPELSAREIARIVGRSERAVESVLHRAKQKAREWLVGR